MTQRTLAWNYLMKDELLHRNMLEVLRRGSETLLAAGPEGVLLLDTISCAHMIAAAGPQGAAELLELAPAGELFTAHDQWSRVHIREKYGLKEMQICFQAAWMEAEPPALPPFEGELRLLEPSWADVVHRHYSSSFGGIAYIRAAIGRGMLGLFVGEELAGFAGFHEEGTIGMLEVLPQFRRRGLGRALEAGIIRLALERGQYAFGQVCEGNTASLELQRSMGMAISTEKLYWLY